MLRNPKPSLFSTLALEIPDPLSFTLRIRLGGSQRSVTTVGLAWRTALLIASWAKRSSSCCILGGKLSSGMLSDRKSQRNRPATFECSTKRCSVVVNPDSSMALECRLEWICALQLSQTLRFRLPAEFGREDRLALQLVAPRRLPVASRCR